MIARPVGSLLLFLLLTSVGCSSSFSRLYDSWLTRPTPADAIGGPWVGEWVSDGGHHGRLRSFLGNAEEDRLTNLRSEYPVMFEAKFMGIFTANYGVSMRRQETPGPVTSVTLKGDARIGGFCGGMYHYQATVTPTEFEATYQSDSDHGVFHLRRPATQPVAK